MALGKILWVDDEIESLQSQIIFLQNKGYEVSALTNGFDAVDFVRDNIVDVVLLDETMPGITGLETIAKIKVLRMLWFQVARAYGFKHYMPADLKIHARSEGWRQPEFQPPRDRQPLQGELAQGCKGCSGQSKSRRLYSEAKPF